MPRTSAWYGFGRDSNLDEGIRALTSGDLAVAAERFDSVLSQGGDPTVVRLAKSHLISTLKELALEDVRVGNCDTAIERIEWALKQADYPDLNAIRGRALAGLGDIDGARESLERALALNPRFSCALGGLQALSNEAADSDRLEKLASVLDAHFSHESGSAERWIEESARFAQAGQTVEAIANMESATLAFPTYPDLKCRLGELLLQIDEVEAALAQFDVALSLNSGYTEALANRGVALNRLRRTAEADAAFRELYRLDPHHPVAILEQGGRR
jgi:tetratricopeptide (TPR) repeat protein